jgi:hypothetical protein
MAIQFLRVLAPVRIVADVDDKKLHQAEALGAVRTSVTRYHGNDPIGSTSPAADVEHIVTLSGSGRNGYDNLTTNPRSKRLENAEGAVR